LTLYYETWKATPLGVIQRHGRIRSSSCLYIQQWCNLQLKPVRLTVVNVRNLPFPVLQLSMDILKRDIMLWMEMIVIALTTVSQSRQTAGTSGSIVGSWTGWTMEASISMWHILQVKNKFNIPHPSFGCVTYNKHICKDCWDTYRHLYKVANT